MRPHLNVVTLFDSIPNKVLECREKWLYVECSTGFPFPPQVMNLGAWLPVGKRPKYSNHNKKFLDFVRSELGDNPKTKTKVFSAHALLQLESRHWCGIGGPSIDLWQRELRLVDDDKYPTWRLHPNRVFFDECPICNIPNSAGCQIDKGRS